MDQKREVFVSVDFPMGLALEWLSKEGVDLGNAKIMSNCGPEKDYAKKPDEHGVYPLKRRAEGWSLTITFDHRSEDPENLRQLKRAISKPFEKDGSPPYIRLKHVREFKIGRERITKTDDQGLEEIIEKDVTLKVSVYVENSYNCTTTCVPADSPIMEELAS